MKTCLVVDDSTVIRKIDFQIVEAEGGEKALEVCQREFPDAILLDWNMPAMDGFDLLLPFAPHARRRPAQGSVLHH